MTQQHDNSRILIIGDAVAPTGFARVIRSIFEPLSRDYELHQLATRYDGGPNDYSWALYPAKQGADVYGYSQLPKLVDEIRPALVFLLYDISFQTRYLDILQRLSPQPKTVFYSPVEAGPIAPEIMRRLEGVTRLCVVYRIWPQRNREIFGECPAWETGRISISRSMIRIDIFPINDPDRF